MPVRRTARSRGPSASSHVHHGNTHSFQSWRWLASQGGLQPDDQSDRRAPPPSVTRTAPRGRCQALPASRESSSGEPFGEVRRLIGMRIAGIGQAHVRVAAAIALIGWHHSSGSPTPASRARVVAVDGIVETQGGATVGGPGRPRPPPHPVGAGARLGRHPLGAAGAAADERRSPRPGSRSACCRATTGLPPSSTRAGSALAGAPCERSRPARADASPADGQHHRARDLDANGACSGGGTCGRDRDRHRRLAPACPRTYPRRPGRPRFRFPAPSF